MLWVALDSFRALFCNFKCKLCKLFSSLSSSNRQPFKAILLQRNFEIYSCCTCELCCVQRKFQAQSVYPDQLGVFVSYFHSKGGRGILMKTVTNNVVVLEVIFGAVYSSCHCIGQGERFIDQRCTKCLNIYSTLFLEFRTLTQLEKLVQLLMNYLVLA